MQSTKWVFYSLWNTIDKLFLITFLLHLVLAFTGILRSDSVAYQALSSIPLTLMYLRAIGHLRVFSNLRHLVRLVVEVIWDMKSFMVLLAILIVAYAVVQVQISTSEVETNSVWFEEDLKNTYVMGFGDFGALGVDNLNALQWVYFLLFTILIPLVFFNLLIAIISDTFDRVYSSKVASDYREKASLILEVESMLRWRRKGTNMQLLYRIIRHDAGDK